MGLAIGFGCTGMAAATIGAGVYLGTVRDIPQPNADTGARERVAASFAQTVIDKTASAIDARFPTDEDRAAPAETPDTNANPTFAFAIPESAQVGPPVLASRADPAKAPQPKLGSVALYDPKVADDAKPSRARTQLAALTPPDALDLAPDDTARTAIYDISAQAVYMPNGEKLEAHSGYGDFMDKPDHVNLKMRGATPPNTYRLTMREKPFHGVEAIRLTPLNEEVMHNRDGILAHTYMLGPNGQSNGCISFKDYGKFLAAFKRGDINRIVVVAKLDQPPAAYARLHPMHPITAWLKKIF
jgi:hypothetical protein